MTYIRTLFLAAALALCGVSCAVDEPVIPDGDRLPVDIMPRAGQAVKAPIDGTVFPADRTLTVSAYYNAELGDSGNYFSDAPFALGEETWVASGTRRWWPFSGTLDFLLWSADGLAVTAAHGEKVTEGVTLTVPDNRTAQVDILHGALSAQRRIVGGNPVQMYHAEACLAFIASANMAYDAVLNHGVTIERIAVEGAYYSGTVAVDPAAAALERCTWSSLGAAGDKDLPMASAYGVPAEAMNISAAGNHMGIGGTGILVPEQDQTAFTVYYTIHNGRDDADNRVDNAMTFHYACEGTWDEGRKYVYTIVFALNEIEIIPTVVDWDDGQQHGETDTEVRGTGAGIPEHVGADFTFTATDTYMWRPDASSPYAALTGGTGTWGTSVTWRHGRWTVTLTATGASYAWSYREDAEREPVTLEAVTGGTVYWKDDGMASQRIYVNDHYENIGYSTIEYSLNGDAWTPVTSTTAGAPIATLAAGDRLRLRGTGKRIAYTQGGFSSHNPSTSYIKPTRLTFSSGMTFNASGDIGTLILGEGYNDEELAENANIIAAPMLFYQASGLLDASGLTFPEVTPSPAAYWQMFYNCTALTTAPQRLPATLSTSCYHSMFLYCTALTTAPELPATALTPDCYNRMFYQCSSLATAPALPATILTPGCYQLMFAYTNLSSAPELPATEATPRCYQSMFAGCNALTAPPVLPATTVAVDCYNGMFSSCRALTSTPALPAMKMETSCYANMFGGCTALTTASSLPATTLAQACYSGMFSYCSVLTAAPPELPAEEVPQDAYNQMFRNCTSLVTAPAVGARSCSNYSFSQMFYGCSNLVSAPPTIAAEPVNNEIIYACSEIFYGCPKLKTAPSKMPCNGDYGCYHAFYNCTALEDGPTELLGGALGQMCCYEMFYGCTRLKNAPAIDATEMTGTQACYSMFYNCQAMTSSPPALHFTSIKYAGCYNMFYNCRAMTSAPSIAAMNVGNQACYQMFYNCQAMTTGPAVLPATVLGDECYRSMFQSCTSLTAGPELPATALKKMCYMSMFQACSGLTAAPVLASTTLAETCYRNMFSGCVSLTSAPALPATTLKNSCYMDMFSNCRTLINAPALPATTLEPGCYSNMFSGCYALTSAPALPATTLAASCYQGMFQNCTSLTSVPTLPATTLALQCCRSMFSGCTSLTAAPALPATQMERQCYYSMFSGCYALTSAPELPATTLAEECYYGMFTDCSALTSAPELPATTLAPGCYRDMFYHCSSLVNAPVLRAPVLQGSCYSRMFGSCSRLAAVKMMATEASAYQAMAGWLSDTASSGVLTINDAAAWDISLANLPSGWTTATATE